MHRVTKGPKRMYMIFVEPKFVEGKEVRNVCCQALRWSENSKRRGKVPGGLPRSPGCSSSLWLVWLMHRVLGQSSLLCSAGRIHPSDEPQSVVLSPVSGCFCSNALSSEDHGHGLGYQAGPKTGKDTTAPASPSDAADVENSLGKWGLSFLPFFFFCYGRLSAMWLHSPAPIAGVISFLWHLPHCIITSVWMSVLEERNLLFVSQHQTQGSQCLI